MERGKKKPICLTIEALKAASNDEAKAVAFMESRRWQGEAWCPYCESRNVYTMRKRGTEEREKNYRWRCRQCSAMFTVRTGTVMEETRLPLRVWCFAFWQACASKKGVAAMQIHRECQISYKSALFLMHRVRYAMDNAPDKAPLKGDVEVDELYIGGKPRFRRKRGQPYTNDKIPVLGMVERGGQIRLRVPEHAGALEIGKVIRENVDPNSRLITDESRPYWPIGKAFKQGHESVKHSAYEYVRGDVHTNTIEGAFSLIRRGLFGIFHSVSPEHLHRYLAEFEFRYNQRYVNDGPRVEAAIRASLGKRLRYDDYVHRKAV